MSAPHLRVRDLSVATRRGEPILSGLSLDCGAGECVAVVGASGSGKSTAAMALLGLLDPALRVSSGSALLRRRDGGTSDLLALPARERRALAGREVAAVFQDPLAALNPIQTVGRQIAEAIAAHERLGRREMERRVLAALAEARLAEPERVARLVPGELSGGMRQRALIALALAARPRLLVADEPTTSLDVTLQAEILELLAELREKSGLSLLLITHDMGVVAELADRVVVLDGGAVAETADAKTLFDAPRSAPARTLLASRPQIPAGGAAPARPAGEAVLHVEDLSVAYEARGLLRRKLLPPVVTGLSLQVRRGEIVGVVGGSGSGKTTLGRAILGLVPPAAGAIRFGEARAITTAERVRTVQAVFQDPAASLNPRRRVGAIVTEPLLLHERLTRAERAERAAMLLERVGLEPALGGRFAHALSGGQQQRVAIARALALSPRLLVADEALSALDMTTQARIVELFCRLAAEDGLSILIVSHDLAAVGQISDRVAVIDGGRIVEIGSPGEVLSAPRSEAAQRLVAAIPASHPSGRRRASGPSSRPFIVSPAA